MNANTQAVPAMPQRQMRILVVDDLEINRDLLARRVRRLGHEVGVAIHGRDALLQLEREAWDMVLLDITMPEMDGYEALQHIRADPRFAQLPVVMVSAIDETESVVRCLELGADDYLTKPFNPLVLKARVEASLAKKRLVDQQQLVLQALSREMEIGQRIQQGFLPAGLPEIPGWSLAAMCRPARRVGGDFYDAFMLPSGQLALSIADVCDKGVGAALYMALFRTLLRVTACQAPAAETAADTLAAQLSGHQRLHRHRAWHGEHVRDRVLRGARHRQRVAALRECRTRATARASCSGSIERASAPSRAGPGAVDRPVLGRCARCSLSRATACWALPMGLPRQWAAAGPWGARCFATHWRSIPARPRG